MIRDTLAELRGIIEGAGFAERVAWVRSALEVIEVKADHLEADWRQGDAPRPLAANLGYEWLRRSGAGHIRRSDGQLVSVAIWKWRRHGVRKRVYQPRKCSRCGSQIVHISGPRHAYCEPCSATLRRERVREAMRRARASLGNADVAI
jgi:DNA-directed RNA polymerase subunit RPC12/RpoP